MNLFSAEKIAKYAKTGFTDNNHSITGDLIV